MQDDVFEGLRRGLARRTVAQVGEIKKGQVMCEVKLDLSSPGSMASVMTLESLDDLNLKTGDTVKVIVKAVNVLLVKE